MRYLDENNGDSIAITVRTDGVDCPELRPSDQGTSCQCWIAVKSGQSLSVLVDLELNTSQYQVDLVVDGVVRNIKLSTVTPKNEGRQATFEFYEGVHKYMRSLFRSGMKTSRLQTSKEISFNRSDHTSVGTIEVLVYKYDQGFGHIRDAKLPEHIVDWEDLDYEPGTSGVHPTHEVIFAGGARLTDTERRTWRNKSERVPMGKAPMVSFKLLYRHEQALRRAKIVDAHLNILPTADAVSAMAAGLLQMAAGSSPLVGEKHHSIVSQDAASTEGPTTPVNGVSPPTSQTGGASNPYAVSERNGCRIYKLLTINPDKPGPQTNNARGFAVGKSTKKRKKRAKARRSTAADADTDSEDDYVPSNESSPSPDNNKRRKTADVEDLRAKVAQMQADLNDAKRLEDMEKSKTDSMDLALEEQYSTLAVQKAALEHQIEQSKVQIERYKKRQAELLERVEEPAAASDHGAVNGNDHLLRNDHVNGNTATGGDGLVIWSRHQQIHGEDQVHGNGTTNPESDEEMATPRPTTP